MIEELRKKRFQRGYSCELMSRKLKISKTYYWQLEQGKRRLSYNLALKMANIFKCTIDELFANYYMKKLKLEEEYGYVNEIKEN